jgi:hypothetical protein
MQILLATTMQHQLHSLIQQRGQSLQQEVDDEAAKASWITVLDYSNRALMRSNGSASPWSS